MDEDPENARRRPTLFKSGRRKSSLSEKLNKLTNSAFHRRRTSGTSASLESSASQRRRSYIPTPSFGSRTSSLFGGLGTNTAEDTNSSRLGALIGRGVRNRDQRKVQEETHVLSPAVPLPSLGTTAQGHCTLESSWRSLKLTHGRRRTSLKASDPPKALEDHKDQKGATTTIRDHDTLRYLATRPRSLPT